MPAKMISDMPLPIPRSVTCSPSHMMKQVPVVRVRTTSRRKLQPGSYTRGRPPAMLVWLSSQKAMANACTTHSSSVP